jgi:hypothetical protein
MSVAYLRGRQCSILASARMPGIDSLKFVPPVHQYPAMKDISHSRTLDSE